jgi:hypothetical protein
MRCQGKEEGEQGEEREKRTRRKKGRHPVDGWWSWCS